MVCFGQCEKLAQQEGRAPGTYRCGEEVMRDATAVALHLCSSTLAVDHDAFKVRQN